MTVVLTCDSPACDRQTPLSTGDDTHEWLREIYEGIFEDVFGSWLGNYSCPYVSVLVLERIIYVNEHVG